MNRRHLPWGPEKKIKPEPNTSMGVSVGKGSRDLGKQGQEGLRPAVSDIHTGSQPMSYGWQSAVLQRGS